MRIGELARETGVSSDTIRYYERVGLMPHVPRTAAGYRDYPAAAAVRIRIVRNAVRLGIPLKEIAGFLRVRDAGGSPCRQVRDYGERLLVMIDARIRELRDARASMAKTLRAWDRRLAETAPGERAHLLEDVSPSVRRVPHRL